MSIAADTLSFRTSVDLRGWKTGLETAERWIEQIEQRVATIRPPTIDFKAASGDAANPAADLASAFIPAANQIRGTLQGAFSGLEPVFGRMAAQIEALTGGSLAHFRRLDSEVRFPQFMGAISKLRGFVQGQFDGLEGAPLKFAKATDRALGGLAFGAKLKAQFDSLRSFSSNSAREIANIKGPRPSFAPAVAGVDAVKGAADRATGSFKGLGLQIAGALGFVSVGYKAVGFLRDAIKNASDLNEVTNKTNVILESGSPAVRAFADEMARDFGTSKAATLEVATSIAGLGKGLGGLKGDKLASFATGLTRLAADVSSIDNKSLKAVGDAFLVGLSGEQSQVLKELGIVLTETTVKAFALSHGIGKIGQELSEENKLAARAGLITEKLAFANGDLARTIGDPANAYRRFTGQVENLGASLGIALLPAVNEVLAGMNALAGGTDDALGRSKTAFSDWATSTASAINTASLYIQNWDDTVELATLSAEQGITNFANRIENKFGEIGQGIADAFTHPLSFIQDELSHLWLNTKNIFANIKELATKGIAANFVDINEGWGGGKMKGLRAPAPAAPMADFSAEMAAIADRIEARRAVKPVASLPATARPDLAVAAIDAKKLEKAQNDLESFAKSFIQKIRNPMEEYAEAMKKAREALDKGLISKEQFKRADAFARREAGFEAPKFAGAQELGSREAYTTLLAAMSGQRNDFGQRIQQQVLLVNQEQVRQLKQVNKLLGASNDSAPMLMMKV